MSGRPIRACSIVVVSALAIVAGCSDGDGDGSAPTDAPGADTTTALSATDGPATVPVETDTRAATDPVPTDRPTTAQETTTIGTVPDTGVPGIESEDAFCRSWSEFAGSFQALSLATAFGTDGDAAIRLELAASPVLIGAAAGMDEHLPPELEPERASLAELVAPMARRAGGARAQLVDAGLTDADIDALGAAWLEALTAVGLDEPDIPLAVTAAVEPAFAAAAEAHGAAVPPVDRDPSLISDARIPLTERYLGEHCPDQGTLGGNDVIDP